MVYNRLQIHGFFNLRVRNASIYIEREIHTRELNVVLAMDLRALR